MERKGKIKYLKAIMAFVFSLLIGLTPIGIVSNVAVADEAEEKVFNIHFIDVGQGDATFIEFPDGKTMLIDAGESEYGRTVAEYIKQLGYSKIDTVVATHSDSDHVGGMSDILDEFEVQYILRPFAVAKSVTNSSDDLTGLGLGIDEVYIESNEEYANFISKAYTETFDGQPSKVVTLSDRTFCENFLGFVEPYYMVQVLFPVATGDILSTVDNRTSGYKVEKSDEPNEMSAVMFISIFNRRILLMADATEGIENNLISSANLNSDLHTKLHGVDILKVAHHGSRYSNTENFLSLVKPTYAVISVGEDNDYGHPSSETLSRLTDCGVSEIFRSDKNGSIVLTINDVGAISSTVQKVNGTKIIPTWALVLIFSIIIIGIGATIVIFIVKNRKKKEDSVIRVEKQSLWYRIREKFKRRR